MNSTISGSIILIILGFLSCRATASLAKSGGVKTWVYTFIAVLATVDYFGSEKITEKELVFSNPECVFYIFLLLFSVILTVMDTIRDSKRKKQKDQILKSSSIKETDNSQESISEIDAANRKESISPEDIPKMKKLWKGYIIAGLLAWLLASFSFVMLCILKISLFVKFSGVFGYFATSSLVCGTMSIVIGMIYYSRAKFLEQGDSGDNPGPQ